MAKKRKRGYKKLKRQLRKLQSAGGMAPGSQQNTGMFTGLSNLLPSRRAEQFLLGLALGAAGAYVLGDEELRRKIMKFFLKMYGGVASGLEEMKEQAEDIKAELAAEQTGAI